MCGCVWRGRGREKEKERQSEHQKKKNKGREMRGRIAETKLLFKPGGRENITINNLAI